MNIDIVYTLSYYFVKLMKFKLYTPAALVKGQGHGHQHTTLAPCTQRDDCAFMNCAGINGQDHTCENGLCVCLDIHGMPFLSILSIPLFNTILLKRIMTRLTQYGICKG